MAGDVGADLLFGQVDHHQRAVMYPGPEVDGRAGLADDAAGGVVGSELVGLGLDGVDDLQLESAVEGVVEGAPPVQHLAVLDLGQQVAAEGEVSPAPVGLPGWSTGGRGRRSGRRPPGAGWGADIF